MARTVHTPRRSVVVVEAVVVAGEAAAAVVVEAAAAAAAAAVVDTTAYDLMCKTVHARADYKGSVDKMVLSVQTVYDATIIVAGLCIVNANAQHHHHAAAAAAAQAEMIAATSEMEAARVAFLEAQQNWTAYRRNFPVDHCFSFPA
jgi:hypothetical protein